MHPVCMILGLSNDITYMTITKFEPCGNFLTGNATVVMIVSSSFMIKYYNVLVSILWSENLQWLVFSLLNNAF